MADEQVLCLLSESVETLILDSVQPHSAIVGFIGADTLPLGRLVQGLTEKKWFVTLDQHRYIPRSECEHDPSWRQLVTYCVINSGGFVLSYERGRAGGEPRLHTCRSVGVGGHVNARDTDGCLSVDSLYRAAAREVHEEFQFGSSSLRFQYAGLINDLSDDVGRVHLGLVFEAFCDYRGVTSRTEECMCPIYLDPTTIHGGDRDEYEGWSKTLLGAMSPGAIKFP